VVHELAATHSVEMVPVVQFGMVPPVIGIVPQQTSAIGQFDAVEHSAPASPASGLAVPVSGLLVSASTPPSLGAGELEQASNTDKHATGHNKDSHASRMPGC
jgi:hypothetical protein